LLGLVLTGAILLLGAQLPSDPGGPPMPAAILDDPVRRLDIQRLRVVRRHSLVAPGAAVPALNALCRGAHDEDVRARAAALLLDTVTRAPEISDQEITATIRHIYVTTGDDGLRERALLTLLSLQLDELPEGARGAFLAAILPQVLRSSQRHRIPPSVSLAQAVLESGWGRSSLAQDHHNLFGVKAGQGQTAVAMSTVEHEEGGARRVVSSFRRFDRPAASIEHHAELLAEDPRYAEARAHWTDWRAFLRLLAPTYATDPHYAQRVAQLVEDYELDRWDPLVRSATRDY
jgi:hypothetical protein